MSQFKIDWIDRGREPQCAPDPAYPRGKDIDIAPGQSGCMTLLPYPARRCGLFYVECTACGTNALVTTAGRPDDPRSLRLQCKREGAH